MSEALEKITSIEQYLEYKNEASGLIGIDPTPDSQMGIRLAALVEKLVEYERLHYSQTFTSVDKVTQQLDTATRERKGASVHMSADEIWVRRQCEAGKQSKIEFGLKCLVEGRKLEREEALLRKQMEKNQCE